MNLCTIILSNLCFHYATFSAATLDLRCVVCDFRVRTSHKCIFVVFVCFLYFLYDFALEKNKYFCGFLSENQPQTPRFSGFVCLSLGGEG